jgi:hypothetical protein
MQPQPTRDNPTRRTPPKTPTCPDCGAKIARQSGCVVCLRCGWSRCG